MKKSFVLIVSFVMFFSSAYLINADVFKPGVSKNIKNLKKFKPPIMQMSYIKFISPDLTPGQTLEAEGKNFGVKTPQTKFYVGGYLADIIVWTDTFIKLKFPNSIILGKKIKSYIKRGNTIVSNQLEQKLLSSTFSIKPDKVLFNYKPSTTSIKLIASWTGLNKSGLFIRFRNKGSINNPAFTPVLSITNTGEENILVANLPSGLKQGIYLVDLMQNGRVASEPPALKFKVLKFVPIKSKILIK